MTRLNNDSTADEATRPVEVLAGFGACDAAERGVAGDGARVPRTMNAALTSSSTSKRTRLEIRGPPPSCRPPTSGRFRSNHGAHLPTPAGDTQKLGNGRKQFQRLNSRPERSTPA